TKFSITNVPLCWCLEGYLQRLTLVIMTAWMAASLCGCALVTDEEAMRNWHAHRSSGQVALSRGDYGGAQASFEAALRAAKTLDKDLVHTAISLKDLTEVCKKTSDQREADRLGRLSIALAENAEHAEANERSTLVLDEVGQALNNLGDLCCQSTQYQEAIPF